MALAMSLARNETQTRINDSINIDDNRYSKRTSILRILTGG